MRKIDRPLAMGTFSAEEKEKEEIRYLCGEEEDIILHILIDVNDGVIADVRYQMFGGIYLLGILDSLATLLLRKNYDQARRVTADLIEKEGEFPEEAYREINLALSALDKALADCDDIPLAEEYVSTPVNFSIEQTGEYPDWENLSYEEKLGAIKFVIDKDIRPYVELDEGGVTVKELQEDTKVLITYEGSCTSCYAATGSTLSAIQQILQAKIHPQITVIPDLG